MKKRKRGKVEEVERGIKEETEKTEKERIFLKTIKK